MRGSAGSLANRGRRPVRGGRRLRIAVGTWISGLLPFGCALGVVGDPDAGGPPAILEGPAIRDGLRDEEEARIAAALLTEGEALLREGRAEEARDRAQAVEERYPEAVGSGFALWLDARASAQLQEWERTESAVERYLALVDAGGPNHAAAAVLRVEARWNLGTGTALPELFEVPLDETPEFIARVDSLAMAIAREIDTPALTQLVQEAPRHPRVLPAFLVELAVRRYLTGAEADARQLAQDALSLSPGDRVAARATGVMEGRVDEGVEVSGVLGAILSESGAPSLQQASRDIQEGIEVALAVEQQGGMLPVRLIPVGDGGDPSRAAAAVAGVEGEGALGVVGPLLEPVVEAAARSRTGPLPIISPTARTIPSGVEGVFSLAGVDPETGRALGELVLSQAVRQVVVLHPAVNEMYEEAQHFRQAFEAGGGVVVRTLTYPGGTTGFGAQLQEVVRLAPSGLVVLLPQGDRDVELLAPQLVFYGVREVEGMMLFGNEAWTLDSVLESLQAPLTNGVLAVSSWPEVGEFGPGWSEFVSAYEETFRRTLRTPTPALGYDAARLLLTAARLGGGTPEGTLRALQEVREFPGATGVFSVIDGRIVRRYFPVRIEDRRLVPLSP